MRLVRTSLILVMSLIGSAYAEGDALVDTLGPREIAVGEALRGAATGASAIGLNPAGLPLNRELVFEGGYGYRASDSASLVGVSACDSTNVVPGCFFYQYAGSNPELGGMELDRSTHVFGTTLSKPLVPRVLVGVTAKYFRFNSEVMDEPDASGFTFDLGATVRLTDMINIGVSGQNLVATEDSTQFPRAIGGGVLARPLPILALGFDSRWKTDDGGARYGGGAELFLRGGEYGFPIRAGAVHDNGLDATYVSAGLGVAHLKWGLDVGLRREVKGGDETLVLASMRFFGPRMAAPSVTGQ